MNYITVSDKKNIINTILSVDKSLFFVDANAIYEKMKLINFQLISQSDNQKEIQLEFEGNIRDKIVKIKFALNSKNAPDNNWYLIEKTFYRQYTLTRWIHRGNDLPALIRYSFGQEQQTLSHLEYHIGGDFKRINKKAPVIISEHETTTEFHYNNPDDIQESDFHSDYILIMNETNTVIDALIQYGESECSFKSLTEIIPETAHFTLVDFVNLNKKLNKLEKKLIQMANI